MPFANNLAEQSVRMPKVKQKVSGCAQTHKGAQTYCVVRSCCATLHRQEANIFEALVASFMGRAASAQLRLKPMRPSKIGRSSYNFL